MSSTRYWIVVISKDQVIENVRDGLMQIRSGNPEILKRISVDDWVIYYSPTLKINSPEICQTFSAIAKVTGAVFDCCNLGNGLTTFQRQVHFFDCRELSISPLITNLNFITNKRNWGYKFRFGILEIQAPDFELIRSHMLPFINGTEVQSIECNAPEHGFPL